MMKTVFDRRFREGISSILLGSANAILAIAVYYGIHTPEYKWFGVLCCMPTILYFYFEGVKRSLFGDLVEHDLFPGDTPEDFGTWLSEEGGDK